MSGIIINYGIYGQHLCKLIYYLRLLPLLIDFLAIILGYLISGSAMTRRSSRKGN